MLDQSCLTRPPLARCASQASAWVGGWAWADMRPATRGPSPAARGRAWAARGSVWATEGGGRPNWAPSPPAALSLSASHGGRPALTRLEGRPCHTAVAALGVLVRGWAPLGGARLLPPFAPACTDPPAAAAGRIGVRGPLWTSGPQPGSQMLGDGTRLSSLLHVWRSDASGWCLWAEVWVRAARDERERAGESGRERARALLRASRPSLFSLSLSLSPAPAHATPHAAPSFGVGPRLGCAHPHPPTHPAHPPTILTHSPLPPPPPPPSSLPPLFQPGSPSSARARPSRATPGRAPSWKTWARTT